MDEDLTFGEREATRSGDTAVSRTCLGRSNQHDQAKRKMVIHNFAPVVGEKNHPFKVLNLGFGSSMGERAKTLDDRPVTYPVTDEFGFSQRHGKITVWLY